MTLPYRIGCPGWSNKDWIGTVFRPHTPSDQLLREYSRIFNTVECNTLFYALPSMATLERWMSETPDSFRFAPKFPKAISHERRLANAENESRAFYKLLETLAHGERLGSSFLQLPPSFNANKLDTLERYLKQLPKSFSFAVEARHVSWYDGAENEKRLDDLLESTGMDKVIFDTRPLFEGEPEDAREEDARRRKPQTPLRKEAIGKRPMLRFVGKRQDELNEPYLKEWTPILNKWILEGKEPYVFAHCGNDSYAPFVARNLHRQLKRLHPRLPDFPELESERSPAAKAPEQLDLF